MICALLGHKMTITGVTGEYKWCSRCAHREEVVGPDGMTAYSREMHRQWARRDEAQAKIDAVIAERTGIDADLVPHMQYTSLVIATLLGLKVADDEHECTSPK